jgi:hypothetical protein
LTVDNLLVVLYDALSYIVFNSSRGHDDVSTSRKAKFFLMRPLFKWMLVAAVGVLVVLTVTLVPLYCVERDVTFTVHESNATTVTQTEDGFDALATVEVSSTNDNYFKIYVDTLSVNVRHPLYNAPLSESTVKDVVLSQRATTEFDIHLDLSYTVLVDTEMTYLSQVLSNCSHGTGLLYFDVHVVVDYHVWARSGQRTEDLVANFPCPESIGL